MRLIDRRAIKGFGIPALCLMENAGRLVAIEAAWHLKRSRGRRVGILCGTGNNGGDGLVAARHLANAGFIVIILLTGTSARLTAEARTNFRIVQKLKIPLFQSRRFSAEQLAGIFQKQDLVIDAIFGIGLNRDVEGNGRRVIEALNASRRPVLSVDVPSGLDATTGRVLGICVKAKKTVVLACLKKGLLVGDGPRYAGEVVVVDIGIPLKMVKGK